MKSRNLDELWTSEDTDLVFNTILPLKTIDVPEWLVNKLAHIVERESNPRRAVKRRIENCMTRPKGLEYIPGPSRGWRGGQSWSPVEKRLLRMALDPKREPQQNLNGNYPDPPTVEYVARIFQRTVKEVQAKLNSTTWYKPKTLGAFKQ